MRFSKIFSAANLTPCKVCFPPVKVASQKYKLMSSTNLSGSDKNVGLVLFNVAQAHKLLKLLVFLWRINRDKRGMVVWHGTS